MNQPDPYGLGAARRSLRHFVLGRAASALAGLGVLLLLVRVMPAPEYGALVAWLAVLEIQYLVNGFGLSSIAQRYVPEYRSLAGGKETRRLVRNSMLARMVLAVVFAGAAAWAAQPLAVALGLSDELHSTPMPDGLLLAALIFTGTIIRYADELLAALLMQGVSQGMALLRNLGKLGVLVPAWLGARSVSANEMLVVETLLAGASAAVALVLMTRGLRSGPQPAVTSPPRGRYRAPGMMKVSLRFYVVQLLGQVYGASAMKLLVTRTLGLEATAVYGFCQALIDMLRNYLPAHLLAGWIRPLLVARYLSSGSPAHLIRLASLVLKVNLLGVLAGVSVLTVAGDAVGMVTSGGRFAGTGALLLSLTVLVGLQTAHLLLSMVTLTLERATANLVATMLACSGLPVAMALAGGFGLPGVAAGLIFAETVWIVTVWIVLRHAVEGVALEWAGVIRLVAPLVPALLVALPLREVLPWSPAGAAGASLLLYLLGCLALKPLTGEERQLLTKFLPGRNASP